MSISLPQVHAPPPDPFDALLAAHPLGAWVHDPVTLRILAANAAAAALYGYDGGLRGVSLAELDTDLPVDAGIRLHRRADGTPAWMELASGPATYAGRPARLVAVRPAPPGAGAPVPDADERFRRVLESAPIGMAVLAPDGRWILVNRALCRLTGYGEAELLAGRFQDITHPDDLEPDLRQVRRVLAGEIDGYEMEKRYLRKDGGVTWARLSVAAVRAPGGAVAQFISQVADVTEAREARAALQASERRFRSLIENASDAVVLLDAAGVVTFASPSVRRLLGWDPAEVEGRPVEERVHPDDRAAVRSALAASLAGSTGRGPALELRFAHADGEWRVLEARASNRVDDPAVGGVVVNARDVTRRRADDDALRRYTARLEALLEAQREIADAQLDFAARAAIIVERAQALTGGDGAVLELVEGGQLVCHAAAGSLAGREGVRLPLEGSLSGTAVLAGRVMRTGDAGLDPRAHRGEALATGVRSVVAVPVAVDGRRIGALKAASVQADAFGEFEATTMALLGGVMSAAVRDALAYEKEQGLLAASRAAAEKLGEAAAELRRSNRELQDFAYIASHDLQEPLRKIRAFGDRLARQAGPALDEPSRDSLARMQSAAGRMQQLIHDLLAYSRVATGSPELAPVPLDAVLREVEGDLAERVAATGGRIEAGALPVVHADRSQMTQLLTNLVANALKFHRPGAPPVVRVTGRTLREGGRGWAEVQVADEGIGIEPRHLERIFGAFQRLHGRGEYEGTGMGLAICRRIAERHGGTVTAAAAPGGGTAFTVRLPLRGAKGAA